MAGLQAGPPILWNQCADVFKLTDVAISNSVDDVFSSILKKSRRVRGNGMNKKADQQCDDAVETAIWQDALGGFELKSEYVDWGNRYNPDGCLKPDADPNPHGKCGHFHKHSTIYGVICAGCGCHTDQFDVNDTMDEATHRDDTRKRTSVCKDGERSGSYFFNNRSFSHTHDNMRMLFNARKREEAEYKKEVKHIQPLFDWRNGALNYLHTNGQTKMINVTTDLFLSRGAGTVKNQLVTMPEYDSTNNPEEARIVVLFQDFAERLKVLEEEAAFDILSKRSTEEKALPVKAAEVSGDLAVIHNTGYPDIEKIFAELVRHGRNATHIDIPANLDGAFNAIRRILDDKCQMVSSRASFVPREARNSIAQIIMEDNDISHKLSKKLQYYLININIPVQNEETSEAYCGRIIDFFLKNAPTSSHMPQKGRLLKNGVEIWDHIKTVLNSA